jgi:hypothetical protein
MNPTRPAAVYVALGPYHILASAALGIVLLNGRQILGDVRAPESGPRHRATKSDTAWRYNESTGP